MGSLGDAFIDVHGNTDPFEGEVRRGVREGAEEADDEAREAGESLGETMGEAMGDELRNQGPNLARQVEAGLSRQKIRTKVTAELDRSGNTVRQWVTTITDDITDAFDSVDTRGATGVFGRFRMAVSDAIGAGFNISGRSPLIAFLVPVIGAIAALITGAIQAVNGLVALLTLIPGLLTAIGLEIAVVAIAFDGMGEAIQGAFAAKNAKELNEAIKDLTPSAQEFVRQLLPLRDLFNDLKPFIQENFFAGLGQLFGTDGALTPLIATLGGLGPLARNLGEMFNQIARALGSPAIVNFINNLLPVVNTFLDRLGPALGQFIEGIGKFAGSPAVLKFMDQFGTWVVTIFSKFGAFLFDLAGDEGFADWLERMTLTLESTGNFLAGAVAVVATLLHQLDQAGGRELIDHMTEGLLTLQTFLASDVGKKGLEGLITLMGFLFDTTIGLIAVILLVLAAFEKMGEIVNLVFTVIFTGLKGLWGDIVDFFRDDAPEEIKGALGNVDNLLYTAGRNIVLGLINGMRSMISSVRATISSIAATITSFLPFSPAKMGPLSGRGDPFISGQEVVNRLAAGITAGQAELGSVMTNTANSIVFGPGAIRVGFEGALPTTQQAMQTGQAVGQGALSILTRSTQLAIRGA